MMYGCHSTISPNRLKHHVVWHSSMKVNWPFVMTRECQYSKDVEDKRCDGCAGNKKQSG